MFKDKASADTYGWYLVFVICCATILSYMDRGIINVLVSDLKHSLSLSEVEVSIIQGFSFSVTFALAGLLIGALVDRFDRRVIIVFGIASWCLMTVLCGMAQTFWQLFAARAGVGVGEACLLPAAYSMVSDGFAAARRGVPMAMVTTATAIGGTTAPLIGGGILMLLGQGELVSLPLLGATETWRVAFFVAASPSILVILLMLTLREPLRGKSHEISDSGSSYVGFLAREWRIFLPLYLAFACIFMLANATAAWAPTAMIRIHGFTASDAGVAVGIAMAPGGVLGTLLGGFLGDRLARRKRGSGRLRAWFGGTFPAVLGAVFFVIDGPAWLFLVGLFLVQLVAGVLTSMSYPALFEAIPPQFRGRSVAVYMLIGNIFGLGLGTTSVALLTERVFLDDNMVNVSMAWVTAVSAVASPLLIMIQLRGYAAMRERMY
jgi:MFS family permease